MKESSGDPRLLAVAAFWPVVCHGSFTLNIVYTPYVRFDADGTLPIQRMKFTRFLGQSQPAGGGAVFRCELPVAQTASATTA